jgi:hypothetical protein
MKTQIFKKIDPIKKGVENFYLSNGINKSISNFRETIPLRKLKGKERRKAGERRRRRGGGGKLAELQAGSRYGSHTKTYGSAEYEIK